MLKSSNTQFSINCIFNTKTPNGMIKFVLLASALILNTAFMKLASAQSNAVESLLNFEVVESGVYQVTHADLVQFGLDISGVPLDQLAITNRSQAVEVELIGSNANRDVFGQGARIRFIGQGIDTLYTDTNVYTLQIDSAAHRAMQQEQIELPTRAPFATTYLATQEYGPQNEYTFLSPNDNDPWFAERILALDASASTTVSIELPDYVVGGNSGSTVGRMSVDLWGASNIAGSSDDHHVQVKFNGQQIIDDTFDGFDRKVMSSRVSNLFEGVNEVTIDLPLDTGNRFDAVNIDKITVSYPRAFVAEDDRLNFTSTFIKFLVRGFSSQEIDVYRSSAGAVKRLISASVTGRCSANNPNCAVVFGGSGQLSEYFIVTADSALTPALAAVPVDNNIRSGNAEYLIVTHPDFIAEANEVDLLGQLDASLQGSFDSVDIVDVEQIYAQFGGHVFDPEAVKDYIAFAHQNRGTKMVLLVGGDIFDYRGFQNPDARSFVPSLYEATDDVINFAPVDAKYVDFDGDNVPDIPIGRLPVRTMQELSVLIDKRSAFLNRDYPQTAIFAADGFDEVQNYDFKADSEAVQSRFFNGWSISDVYLDDLPVRTAREQITAGINQGVSLTSFFGHSSTTQWTFDGMFNGLDAANLSNQSRPTVVTQWGCWNTYYVNPNEDSMGHRFMMEGDRGAVAVMGAITLTSARNESILSKLLYERLANGETLGQAITNAKTEMAVSRPDALDVILGWTLLGFPELTM